LIRGAQASGQPVEPHALKQQSDYEKMEAIRARVAAEVEDPELAARLQPWYNFLCKRPLFSDEYLTAFNRPNVTLIDTDGRGIDRITATGLVANGVDYALDLIILATGFDVGAPPHKVGGYEVVGRDGQTLSERWDGALRTLHGTQLSGFPNFHIVGGTQQGTTAFNFTHPLRMQAEHAAEIIAHCRDKEIAALEPLPAAEERWHALLEEKHVDHEHFYEECTPGFLNNEGKFRDMPTFVGATYGGGPLEYERLLTAWRAEQMHTDLVAPPRAGDSEAQRRAAG
jgi:cyclohexanone monooxygenase